MCSFLLCAAGFCLTHKPNLSLPLGEMSRSDREGRNQLTWLFKFALTRTCLRAALSAICWRKCQFSQGESREAGADCTHAASGELLRRSARVLLLPSRLTPCHLSQGGRLWVSAQPKLVSPSGRDVAQRQRGQESADMAFQICPDTNLSSQPFAGANASSPKGRAEKPVRTAHMPHQVNSCADLPACCSFRHGLRRATFLREEGFGFPRNPNLSFPLGEMSRSDREGLYCFMPPAALPSVRRARTR